MGNPVAARQKFNDAAGPGRRGTGHGMREDPCHLDDDIDSTAATIARSPAGVSLGLSNSIFAAAALAAGSAPGLPDSVSSATVNLNTNSSSAGVSMTYDPQRDRMLARRAARLRDARMRRFLDATSSINGSLSGGAGDAMISPGQVLPRVVLDRVLPLRVTRAEAVTGTHVGTGIIESSSSSSDGEGTTSGSSSGSNNGDGGGRLMTNAPHQLIPPLLDFEDSIRALMSSYLAATTVSGVHNSSERPDADGLRTAASSTRRGSAASLQTTRDRSRSARSTPFAGRGFASGDLEGPSGVPSAVVQAAARAINSPSARGGRTEEQAQHQASRAERIRPAVSAASPRRPNLTTTTTTVHSIPRRRSPPNASRGIFVGSPVPTTSSSTRAPSFRFNFNLVLTDSMDESPDPSGISSRTGSVAVRTTTGGDDSIREESSESSNANPLSLERFLRAFAAPSNPIGPPLALSAESGLRAREEDDPLSLD